MLARMYELAHAASLAALNRREESVSYISLAGRAPALALTASVVIGVSACGGSTKAGNGESAPATSRSAASTTTTVATRSATVSSDTRASTTPPSTAPSQSTEAVVLKFVRCMHAHGIDIPLRHTSHGVTAELKNVDVSTPRYQRLGSECLGVSPEDRHRLGADRGAR